MLAPGHQVRPESFIMHLRTRKLIWRTKSRDTAEGVNWAGIVWFTANFVGLLVQTNPSLIGPTQISS